MRVPRDFGEWPKEKREEYITNYYKEKGLVFKCCICGKESYGYGNNPYPIRTSKSAVCCDECNYRFVGPMRIGYYKLNFTEKGRKKLRRSFRKMTYQDLKDICINKTKHIEYDEEDIVKEV